MTTIDSQTEASHPHLAEEHGATTWDYVKIALILMVLTALEVTASYLDLGVLFIPLLIVLMVVKFALVVLYFMHLKNDAKIFHFLFWSGLALAVFVYVVALATFEFFLSS
jgi:cytochrome c oxidase subunit IV